MVLKKSNSPFNSGATQKCFNRGAYRSINEPSELSLSITLRGLPVVYDENNPSTEHAKALEKIYDYLGFCGPSLKAFHNSDNHGFWDKTVKFLNISLNNQELWLIPERIEKLLMEKNFLDGEEGFAEIHVKKVKRIADRKTIHNKESCVLNPKVKKDSSKDSVKRPMREARGRRRGLQRPHLLTPAPRDDDGSDDDWHEQRQKKLVEIELQEEDHIDARVLGYRSEVYEQKIKLRSKSKSCVNGKKSCQYRIYNPPQLRNEIRAVLNSEWDWEEDDHFCDFYDDDMVEDCEEYYNDRCRKQIFDYLHFSSESNSSKKKIANSAHEDHNIHVNDEQLVNVNTASSKMTIRFPKGSFKFIKRPCDIAEDNENFVYVDNDEIKRIHYSESHTQEVDIEKTESPIMFDTFQSKDNFVAVDLQLPDHIQKTIVGSLLQSNCYNFSVNDSNVTLGNCYPPVFCVNLQQSDSSSVNVWSLVGTSSSDVSSSEDLSWEVTLKNTKSKSVHHNDKVKENFFCNLNLMKNCVLQFNELIQMALVSVQNASNHDFGNEDCVPTPKFVTKDFKGNVSVVTYNNAPRPNVCSMEEALKKLQAGQPHNLQHLASPSLTKHSQIMIPNENVECDICFNTCNMHGLKGSGLVTLLPCNHSFCYECWRSHIFYQTTTTSTEIRCMHTDCKEVLNETTMKALIPENYLAQLYLQRQERRIDTSPLCQWCPKSKCNKVSMITERSRHVQDFGCCVVCDCKSSYCFSCQASPHWPMSCSQAAAYINLLYKLGDGIPLDVNCSVDLKPCPGCKYPIEKNEGCPHMTCGMCWFQFCWKCLQSTNTHRVWECTADEKSTFVTYHLHNDVVNTFPLKFFRNSFDIRKRYRNTMKTSIHSWLKGLNNVNSKKIKPSFERSVQLEEAEVIKTRVIHLATECISFLLDSYSFLEYFYILFSFALLNKERDSKTSYLFTQRLMDRLVFTTSRLEGLIVGKSLRQLIVSENISQMSMGKGREILEILKNRVALIQKASKDVPAKDIGELDPNKYYRYK